VLSCIIGQLREMPDVFAGYYFPTICDVWTFYWGAVDAAFNAKLSWFVVRGCYAPVYVTGLHGSVEHRRGEKMEIVASNFGEALSGAALRVVVRDGSDKKVAEYKTGGLSIAGDAAVSRIGEMDLSGLETGLCSVEFHLTDEKGEKQAERVELFYLVR
jgi:hypothetical protein